MFRSLPIIRFLFSLQRVMLTSSGGGGYGGGNPYSRGGGGGDNHYTSENPYAGYGQNSGYSQAGQNTGYNQGGYNQAPANAAGYGGGRGDAYEMQNYNARPRNDNDMYDDFLTQVLPPIFLC